MDAIEETLMPEAEEALPMEEAAAPAPLPGEEAPEASGEPEEPPKKKKLPVPVLVLGIAALLAAVLLVSLIVVCLPYMNSADDPELVLHQTEATVETTTEAAAEPTETEPPTEPTIPPEENPYGRLDFQYKRNNYLYCLRAESYEGVDVSAFQGDIDWQKVKASGIDFAIIRLGYRGYTVGGLVEDEYAEQNLKGATEAGLPIGAYFFSQALTIEEADEEIAFMLETLGDYELEMPIVLDWEIPAAHARTANMDARTLTDIQLHFCEVMTEKGYTPMVYFNWHQSENLYYLHELEDYPFWLALYQDRMTFPWKVEMWQWTCTGRVPGINADVDINVYMPD